MTILFFEFIAVKSAEDHSSMALILFDHIIEKKSKRGSETLIIWLVGCTCTMYLLYDVPLEPPWWHSGRAFASHARDRGSIPDRDIPESLKQVMTVPLPNGRQLM